MSYEIPKFAMPMFHDWVPRAIRPWLYVLTAFCFQFSSGVYLGAMNDMIGEHAWMREDVTMLLYCSLAGMAVWFPVLFRMKFHFTNKTLILASAVTVAACNLLTMHRLPLPAMALLCIVSGMAKIQGTFECMSSIQPWITPRRNFGVFFPVLHIILLTAIEVTGFLSAAFAFYQHWTMMHWFIIGLMMLVILLQVTLTRPFCPMPPEKRVPLKGIDWQGGALWLLFWLSVAWVLNYGDWKDWYHSTDVWVMTAVACLSLAAVMMRMRLHPSPYISPKIVRYRYMRPIIFFMVLFECIISVEHVLEMIYYEEVMKYSDLTYETLNQWSLIGIYAGCLFSLGWLKVMQWSQYRLIGIGMVFLCLYCMGFYFLVNSEIGYYQHVPPLIARGFGYAVLCIAFMWCLQQVMSFEHFFQALSIFNFLHMFGGGVIGAAILSQGVGYYVGDGFARLTGYINPVAGISLGAPIAALGVQMEGMVTDLLAQTVKILYGWTIYATLAFIAIFLLLDRPGVRHRIKRMPSWATVGAWTLSRFLRKH